MKNRQIIFTKPRTAEYLEVELSDELKENEVLVDMEYTVVSGGTERACLLDFPNVLGGFPRGLGYCGIGHVMKVGEKVTSVKVGDRVLTYHSTHSKYNRRPEDKVTKVEDDNLPSEDAAFTVIAVMGLGGVRKLEIELGESAMVMGLGLLGLFSVQYLHLSGAYPVIAADPNAERRALALTLGADYALDPTEEGFVQKVKEITGGKGVNGCVEVTGVSAAMKQALDCAAWMGRISLLGCTRVSDCAVDYYMQVHRPGVKLIGAHNFVRPKHESYPHHWTHQDDCKATLKLMSAKRIQVAPLRSRIVSPTKAVEIYEELAESKNFPIGTVFDWRGITV